MSNNNNSAVSCRQVCSSFGQVHNRPAPGIKVSTLVYPKYQVQAATGYVHKVNTKPTLVPIIKSSHYGSKFAPPIQWEVFLMFFFGWIFASLSVLTPPKKRLNENNLITFNSVFSFGQLSPVSLLFVQVSRNIYVVSYC